MLMSPAGGASGRGNSRLTTQLGTWAEQDGRGEAFDSSTGYRLPDGSTVSPDATTGTARICGEDPRNAPTRTRIGAMLQGRVSRRR